MTDLGDLSRARALSSTTSYAFRRLSRRRRESALAGLGIAIGAALLALTLVGAGAVQDRAVQLALGDLQPADRAVQVIWSGVPAQSDLSEPQLNALASSALGDAVGQAPVRTAVFRQASWGGVFVNLGAIDNLRAWIRLDSGRQPLPCRPSLCELVQIGGQPVQPKIPGLLVVGQANLAPGSPFTGYFDRAAGRPPILLADGVSGFARFRLPDQAIIARTYGWVVPLDPNHVHDWELAKLAARLDGVQATLQRKSDIFTVTGPTDTIAAVRSTSRVSSERLLLLGGDVTVLLLAFAVFASARMRAEQGRVRQRQRWAGASRAQRFIVPAAETLAVTIVASVVGWLVGASCGGALAAHLGAPAALTVEHALLGYRTLLLAAAMSALTFAVMITAVASGGIQLGGLRFTVADTAALGALATVLVSLARGKADVGALQQGGTGVVLILLPALVLFTLAVGSARILEPLLRLAERASRRTPIATRLAFLSLARDPGQVILAVVFFVISVGIGVFAIAYRTTLTEGQRAQALYSVPALFVLEEDLTKLVTLQQVGLPKRYQTTQLLRDSGFISGARSTDFTVMAIPHGALAHIDGWRSDFSSSTSAQLSHALKPSTPPELVGVALSSKESRFTFPFTIHGGKVGVSLVIANRRGDFTTLDLGERGTGTYRPSLHLPDAARGGRLIAVRLNLPVTAAYVAGHREGETRLGVNDASQGTVRILDPRFRAWLGFGGATLRAPGLYHYVANRAAQTLIRPRQPTDGEAVPVVVSPALARSADSTGIVVLHVANVVLTGRVVGIARYFPSISGDFVVADLGTWLNAVNALNPGTATPSEAWVDAPPSALARFTRLPLIVHSQATELDRAKRDPRAQGSISLLVIAALIAFVLSVIGLTLVAATDLRDEGSSLVDLEQQGLEPSQLRRHLMSRAMAIAVVGVTLGIPAGIAVSALIVSVVTVTASAVAAVPPLELRYGWPLILAAIAAFLVLGGSGARAATRSLR